ncbi:hypothetical protein MTO96_027022 [Rhipicephalus appendiculatus]
MPVRGVRQVVVASRVAATRGATGRQLLRRGRAVCVTDRCVEYAAYAESRRCNAAPETATSGRGRDEALRQRPSGSA